MISNNNRSPEEQERLFSSLLATHEKLLRQAFDDLEGNGDRDNYLNCLKNINTSLRIDPMFILFLSGLPYADFLYETKQEDLYAFLRSIMQILDSFSNDEDNENQKKIAYYFSKLQAEVTEYTGKSLKDIFNNRIEYLPIDEISF